MATKGRVLFCIYSHNIWGGIEFWLTGLARHLRERSWDVTIGLARGHTFNQPEAFRRAYPGLPTVEFDGRTGTSEGRVRAICGVLQRLRPDVVVPVGLGDVFPAIARLKRKGLALRVIAPIRATSAEILGEMEAFAPIIDLCVGNNPLHAAYLAHRAAYPPERLRTIVNGVSLPPTGRPRPHHQEDVLRLLFVGRFDLQQKRVLDLPVLVEELERRALPYRLTLVGKGAGEAQLRHLLQRFIDAGRIRLLGFLPPEQIAREVYPAHDALIHLSSSYGEGCPQVLQQSLAHGVVPVSSEFLGVHSLGFLRDEATCLLFPVGDMVRAADHLERLHRNPDLLREMSMAGPASLRDRDMPLVLQEWEQSLVEVCSLPVCGLGSAAGHVSAPIAPSGRLERWGMTPGLSDVLRRILRRFPKWPDGWAEWPGTLTTVDEATRAAVLAQLHSLDQAARSSLDAHHAPG